MSCSRIISHTTHARLGAYNMLRLKVYFPALSLRPTLVEASTECCSTTPLSDPIDSSAVPSALKRTLPAMVEWPFAEIDIAP